MKKSNEAKGKKLPIIIAAVIIILLPILIFVYIRTHPRWKKAELTIEASESTVKMRWINAGGDTLETRIIPPEGYERIPVEEGSFGAYLRDYPLLPDGIKLPVYDGTTIDREDAAAVFDISLGDEGYQQCADSIIRLYSDYFYENEQYDKISFLLSNGDECDYERWRKGRRMFVLGNFSCELPAAFPDKSEKQYRNYLKEVMRYAGTLSLQKESEVIPAEELRIGDIICNDTHVVMITDEALNEKGEKCYLIGQSFIPAVCYHIVANVNGDEADPWFTQEQLEQDSFDVGPYRFKKKDIRRWKDGF